MAECWDTVYCEVAGADGVVCDAAGTAAGGELELDGDLLPLPWPVAEIITMSAITPMTVVQIGCRRAHRFRGGGCTGCHGGC